MKGDVESLDEQSEVVNVEVKDSNHPDIWSVEGIARALRGFLGASKRHPLRVSGPSKIRVVVDKQLKPIRPYIACAIVKGVNAGEEALKSWINLQDKMDQTYGRKRRKASIGLYQADLVASPLNYTVSKPGKASFVPLGSGEEMKLDEILEKHPKGQEYGPIISSFKEWPLLVDGNGKILSLPPVINSNDLGRITTETRNVLVEVTGTSLETVHNTLKIVVTALAERGGRVYTCHQNYAYPPKSTVTPELAPRPAEVSLHYTNAMLGTSLTSEVASRYLKRAGYGIARRGRDTLKVEVPCYRIDIMHQIDIVEDIAISMNLNSLEPQWPVVWTAGGLSRETERVDTVAEVMIGLGYQELMTYSLTSPQSLAPKMRLSQGPLAELSNPKMSTLTVIRNWILPSLLSLLSENTHVDYPQRVFEMGPCAANAREDVETVDKLAAVTVHANAGYTEIRACLDALLNNLGVKFEIGAEKHSSFLEGRTGAVLIGNRRAGVVGEIHPEVVRAWGLALPTAAFELDLSDAKF